MDDEESDPEAEEAIRYFMKQHELDWDFLTIYGRYPEPGEIDQILRGNIIRSVEQAAKASVRPGILKMLRFWL